MTASLRHDWQNHEIEALFQLPFNDLLYRAQTVHRQHFDPNAVQVSTLLSIKTGACPEDCKYCSQSGHYNTGLEKEKLLQLEKVLSEAEAARHNGATRFCMGAAWKHPSKKDFPLVLEAIRYSGALEHARKRAVAEAELARAAIQCLGDSQYKVALLQLTLFAVERNH